MYSYLVVGIYCCYCTVVITEKISFHFIAYSYSPLNSHMLGVYKITGRGVVLKSKSYLVAFSMLLCRPNVTKMCLERNKRYVVTQPLCQMVILC